MMFLRLLRSPRGLTFFHRQNPPAGGPNLTTFSCLIYKILKDFEQWKLMSFGMAIFFDADFSMGNHGP
jgi:hypothetical protein